jgi:hypothetical protein
LRPLRLEALPSPTMGRLATRDGLRVPWGAFTAAPERRGAVVALVSLALPVYLPVETYPVHVEQG